MKPNSNFAMSVKDSLETYDGTPAPLFTLSFTHALPSGTHKMQSRKMVVFLTEAGELATNLFRQQSNLTGAQVEKAKKTILANFGGVKFTITEEKTS